VNYLSVSCAPPLWWQVKQIAGRAGRRGACDAEGVVTCLHPGDTPQLLAALQEEVAPMDSVGLFPVFEQVSTQRGKLHNSGK